MPIMRTGRAPVGGSMVGKRAATVSRPATTGSRVGARRFAEGGKPENYEQKQARRYRNSHEYRKMQDENAAEGARDAKERAKHPIRSVVDAAKRAKKAMGMAKGGKCYAGGGVVGRGDGCSRYTTRAKIV